jgi:hypothetical protein
VVLETFEDQGTSVRHTAYLSREGGKGLSFCHELAATTESSGSSSSSGSGSGGCTAHGEGDAFRFMTGSISGRLRTVAGAVDGRVATVRVWRVGVEQPQTVRLRDLGVDGLRAFGVTTVWHAGAVERVVAYSPAGAVLQVFDVPATYGPDWSPGSSDCTVRPVPPGGVRRNVPFPGGTASVLLTTTAAHLSVTGSDGSSATACASLGNASLGSHLSASVAGSVVLVGVVGPEVSSVRAVDGKRELARVSPEAVPGSPWRLVVLRDEGSAYARATLVAYDATGRELARSEAGSTTGG